MSRFDTYRASFPNARLTRSKSGVLEVAFHTDGGTLVFDGHVHEQFVHLFHAIGSDPDNRVVILTGSGNAFMETIGPEGFDFFTPQGYDKIYREGRKVLMNILDIEVPLIAAVNGPARLHSEYILLADIVLATPSTVFQDKPHFEIGVACPAIASISCGRKRSARYAAVISSSPARSSTPRRPRNGAPLTRSLQPTSCCPGPARLLRGSLSCRCLPRSTRASR
jgi:enoyl-CoA hydratase/carnithine racemase